jgi:hypothetical protein
MNDTVGQCTIHIQEIATHGTDQQQCPFINEHGGNQCINSLLFSIQKIPKTRDEHFEEFVLVTEEAMSCSKRQDEVTCIKCNIIPFKTLKTPTKYQYM